MYNYCVDLVVLSFAGAYGVKDLNNNRKNYGFRQIIKILDKRSNLNEIKVSCLCNNLHYSNLIDITSEELEIQFLSDLYTDEITTIIKLAKYYFKDPLKNQTRNLIYKFFNVSNRMHVSDFLKKINKNYYALSFLILNKIRRKMIYFVFHCSYRGIPTGETAKFYDNLDLIDKILLDNYIIKNKDYSDKPDIVKKTDYSIMYEIQPEVLNLYIRSWEIVFDYLNHQNRSFYDYLYENLELLIYYNK